MDTDQLNRINRMHIQKAGARYTPGVDASAPNLKILYLLQAFHALTLSPEFQQQILIFHDEIKEAWGKAPHIVSRAFQGIKHSPQFLLESLGNLKNKKPGDFSNTLRKIERTCAFVQKKLTKCQEALWEKERSAKEGSQDDYKIRNEVYSTSRIISSINSLEQYIDSPAFKLIDKNRLFLTGGWGTGKTHFFCDVTKERMKNGLPTLFVLAHHIPPGKDPLQGICEATQLSNDKNKLLDGLQALGEAISQRAVILIDGINESDIEMWKNSFKPISKKICKYPNVAIALSCRSPFQEIILSEDAERHYVFANHAGFEEIEFDAQTEFFKYYNIPTPQFPLLTPEFARPLFLKLVCTAFQNLSDRTKKRKFGEIASGQKGMTYIFEYFIKSIGKNIETEFRLPHKSCWYMLKGFNPKGSQRKVGLSVIMADQNRDYVLPGECKNIIGQYTGLSGNVLENIIQKCISEGILAKDIIWNNDSWQEIIRLPYQKFSDHLIARHLLWKYLKTDSESVIRHSFFRNRTLGKIFKVNKFGTQYAAPNLAEAIMLEFPERVKNKVPDEERELVFFLPKKNRLINPIIDVFLNGLMWRTRDSFTKQTDIIISLLLDSSSEYISNKALETLVCLSSRPNHPLSSKRLYNYLKKMNMAAKDLFWSEFLRKASRHSVVYRLVDWIVSKDTAKLQDNAADNLVCLLSAFLTTTHRELRDRVTYCLYLLGMNHPKIIFDHTLSSLEYNDIYVPERMLAASYGVSMNSWANKANQKFANSIQNFAQNLYLLVFAPNAKASSRHTLYRDYALGIIGIARKMHPNLLANQYIKYIRPPFEHMKKVFPAGTEIDEDAYNDAENAIHMDFKNYTIGRLVSDRGNYDFEHEGYSEVLKQIKWRIINLGYDSTKFKDIDREIASISFRREQNKAHKIDRYGKKYSWIAFFELFGLRHDLGLLQEYRMDHRVSDCDIDPSFPTKPAEWNPETKDLFVNPYSVPEVWLRDGPIPDYEHLLKIDEIDGVRGPWVLLDGYISEGANIDPREIFTFLRGLFLNADDYETFRTKLLKKEYPGNDAIPNPGEDYYTYAGEIPWSHRYGAYFRHANGKAKPAIKESLSSYETKKVRRRKGGADPEPIEITIRLISALREKPKDAEDNSGTDLIKIGDGIPFDEDPGWTTKSIRIPGIKVEIPVHRFSWESYHSILNQVSGIELPAPLLCEALGLSRIGNTWDLFDSNGKQATIYREFKKSEGYGSSHLTYIRKDLLEIYLVKFNKVLVWVNWGERGFNYEESKKVRESSQETWKKHLHIHKQIIKY